jgi:hypothetical protein
VEPTPDDVGDVSALPDLLDQIESSVGSVTADGAYDGVEGPTARKRTVAYFTRYRSLPEAGIDGGQNYRLVLCSY